jgi:hypothetical protein
MPRHRQGYCDRCDHQLTGVLCAFCLAEVLGVRLGRQLPVVADPLLLAPFLQALFVRHFSLRKPLLVAR